MALVAGREAIFAAHVRSSWEGNHFERTAIPLDGPRAPIPEDGQRIGARRLPPVTKTFRKGCLQGMGVPPIPVDRQAHIAPLRKGPVANIAEWIVGPRGRVVRDI